MKYSKKRYINTDPFEGDRDVDIRCKTVKIVKVRKKHHCAAGIIEGEDHYIEKGGMARVEKAIVEGQWGRFYSCIPCLDKMIKEGY